MHARKLAVLLVAVLVLLGLLRLRASAPESDLEAVRLFEGVDSGRVVALRVDHVVRDVQLTLERDAAGRWYLTDPLAYPADDGVVRLLLEVVRTNTGVVRPGAAPDSVGLAPPQALLEAVERNADGTERRTAVELGALDVDSARVWARDAHGRVLLTLRTLHNALDRTPDQYRDRSIVTATPHQVIELERSGAFRFVPGAPVEELAFSAQLEGDPPDWHAFAPVHEHLDPLAMAAIVGGLCSIRVQDFHDDSLDALAQYGLDPPLLRIVVHTAGGGQETVLFGVPPRELARDDWIAEGATWLAMRAGFPFVWELNGRDVRLLASPLEDLLDYRQTGGRRELWKRILLSGAGRETELERDGQQWRMRLRAAGAPEWGSPVAADAARVEDLCVVLESVELVRWLPGIAFAGETGETGATPVAAFVVEDQDGARYAGELGAEHATADGQRGRLYRRAPDGAVFLAGPELERLLLGDPAELESRLVHALDEKRLVALVVRAADGVERRYARSQDGIWHPAEDPASEARELWELLDPLLTLRAERWLPGPVALERALEVRVTDVDGVERRFTLGLGPAGAVVSTGERYAVVGPELHAGLSALYP